MSKAKKIAPQDSKLDAPTLTEDTVIAINNACYMSTSPIEENGVIKRNYAIPGQPSGTTSWYIGGPPGAMVSAILQRVPNSGGHYHSASNDNPLSVGYIFPNDFILTGAYPQNYQVLQTFPQASGSIKVLPRIGSTTLPESIVNVLIEGLLPIVETGNLKLKSPTAIHPSPYWGTALFISKLNALADSYFTSTGKSITITDASLEWGGRFDLNEDWNPPHREHRDGNQADIRSNDMSQPEKDAFLLSASAAGIGVLVESNHWHVRG